MFFFKLTISILFFFSCATDSNQSKVSNSSNQDSVSAIPKPELIDNQDGTISEKTYKLLWQKCSMGLSGKDCEEKEALELSLADASTSCAKTKLNGKKWRLPKIEELEGLIDYTKSSPAIIEQFFPKTQSKSYWSSTTSSISTNAWFVNFEDGTVNHSPKTDTNLVRCVSEL